MAKTKKQAVAATAASARRSETVNARGGCRVGVPTDNVEKGEKIDSASGSYRAKRAARRGTSSNQGTKQGSGEIGGPVTANESRGGHGAETVI